jgi:transcriptional regulator with XRE-family HTH domain
MGLKEDIGIRIRTMRLSRQMKQEDLARSIGQSASSITMYETGRREPDFETMEMLADVFNVPLHSMLSDDETAALVPKTLEARIVSFGMDNLPKEEREKMGLAGHDKVAREFDRELVIRAYLNEVERV